MDDYTITTDDAIRNLADALVSLVCALDTVNGLTDDGQPAIPDAVRAIVQPLLWADQVSSLDGMHIDLARYLGDLPPAPFCPDCQGQ